LGEVRRSDIGNIDDWQKKKGRVGMSEFREFLEENLETEPEFKELWERKWVKIPLVKKVIAKRLGKPPRKRHCVGCDYYL
jgi:hypothetical protein